MKKNFLPVVLALYLIDQIVQEINDLLVLINQPVELLLRDTASATLTSSLTCHSGVLHLLSRGIAELWRFSSLLRSSGSGIRCIYATRVSALWRTSSTTRVLIARLTCRSSWRSSARAIASGDEISAALPGRTLISESRTAS
jgi:hypothetical protein